MAAHAKLFVEQPAEIPAQTIGDYYILSRNRFNRWIRDLNDLEQGLRPRAARSQPTAACGVLLRGVVQDVLINEMLTRIWTILLLSRDRWQGIDRVRPVAHNVFLGHLAIRHKALTIARHDLQLAPADLMFLERLRKSTERWTDLLCCHLMDDFDLWQYAGSEDTAREFLEERVDQGSLDYRSRSWVLVLAGLRHSFPDDGPLATPIHEEDRRLTRLILDGFPDDAPEMTFWMKSRVSNARKASQVPGGVP